MADFLTVAGIPIRIQRTGATQGPPDRIGDRGRAFDGNWISTVRREMRTFDFTSGPLLQSEYEAFRNAVMNDAEVACAGDALQYISAGETFLMCVVEITSAEYLSDGTVDGFFRIVKFTVRESV